MRVSWEKNVKTQFQRYEKESLLFLFSKKISCVESLLFIPLSILLIENSQKS